MVFSSVTVQFNAANSRIVFLVLERCERLGLLCNWWQCMWRLNESTFICSLETTAHCGFFHFLCYIYILTMDWHVQLSKVADHDQLRSTIERYQEELRTTINVKNLKKFVESFLKSVNYSCSCLGAIHTHRQSLIQDFVMMTSPSERGIMYPGRAIKVKIA